MDYDEVDNYKKLPLDVITITLNSMLQQGFLEKVFFKLIYGTFVVHMKPRTIQRRLFQRKYACFVIFLPDHSIQDSHIRVHSNIKKTHHNRSILSHTDIVGGSKLMVLRLSNDVIIAYMYIKLLSRCKKV